MTATVAAWPGTEEAELFRAQGFVTLRRLLSPDEVADLEEAFETAVQKATGQGASVAGIAKGKADSLITVVSPEIAAPVLRSSRLASLARKAMSAFFEVPEERLLLGWRCFLKPAGGEMTPWHQDAAYRPPPHHGGTVWLPLDPATAESGCLEYLPGSHRGPLLDHKLHERHFVTQSHGVDAGVACPLSIGDACVHSCMTVHRAGANQTARPRRAFAVVCQVA